MKTKELATTYRPARTRWMDFQHRQVRTRRMSISISSLLATISHTSSNDPWDHYHVVLYKV